MERPTVARGLRVRLLAPQPCERPLRRAVAGTAQRERRRLRDVRVTRRRAARGGATPRAVIPRYNPAGHCGHVTWYGRPGRYRSHSDLVRLRPAMRHESWSHARGSTSRMVTRPLSDPTASRPPAESGSTRNVPGVGTVIGPPTGSSVEVDHRSTRPV